MDVIDKYGEDYKLSIAFLFDWGIQLTEGVM